VRVLPPRLCPRHRSDHCNRSSVAYRSSRWNGTQRAPRVYTLARPSDHILARLTQRSLDRI